MERNLLARMFRCFHFLSKLRVRNAQHLAESALECPVLFGTLVCLHFAVASLAFDSCAAVLCMLLFLWACSSDGPSGLGGVIPEKVAATLESTAMVMRRSWVRVPSRLPLYLRRVRGWPLGAFKALKTTDGTVLGSTPTLSAQYKLSVTGLLYASAMLAIHFGQAERCGK